MEQQALERGEFCFDFVQSDFEGFTADGIRRALVENALALQFKSLALELTSGACGSRTEFGFV